MKSVIVLVTFVKFVKVSGLLKCPVCEISKMETILYNKSNLAFEMIGIASY